MSASVLAPAGGHARAPFAVLGVLLVVAGTLGLFIGAADLPASTVARVLAEGMGLTSAESAAWERTIVLHLRLPRILMGMLVGASLALSGALMQGIFRNPLADPTLIGVSSGAALGASTMIVAGRRWLELEGWASLLSVPAAAFLAGLATTWLVYRISIRQGRTAVTTMLLAGIAINALAFSGTGFWTFVADDAELRDISFWTLGSLGGASWPRIGVLLLLTGIAGAMAVRAWFALDALLLGEAEAEHIGVQTHRVRRRLIACTAAMVGGAVAVSGQIAFVGLVVPHAIRLSVGPGHRLLLPLAVLGGALILPLADLVARTSFAPVELPIGIMTAFIGAPFFLYLLQRGGAR